MPPGEEGRPPHGRAAESPSPSRTSAPDTAKRPHDAGAGAVRVRQLRLEDLDAVLAIAADSPEAAAWSAASYRDLAAQPGSLALIAERQGEIVGFLVGRELHEQAEVLNLAVKYAARRQGCGTLLLAAALEQFASHGVQSVYLEVRQSNTGAIAFYTQHGFVPSGLRKGYYRSPDEPAVTMVRKYE